jgi:hypothetical protein
VTAGLTIPPLTGPVVNTIATKPKPIAYGAVPGAAVIFVVAKLLYCYEVSNIKNRRTAIEIYLLLKKEKMFQKTQRLQLENLSNQIVFSSLLRGV